MERRHCLLLATVMCLSVSASPQDVRDDMGLSMDDFVRSIHEDFDNFRRNSVMEFAEFLRNPWKEFHETPPVPKPKPEPVPPVVKPDDDRDTPIEDKPVVIEDVVAPVIDETPQSQPVRPIEEVPVVVPEYVDFTFFGTQAKVRCRKDNMPNVKSLSEKSIAKAFVAIADEDNDNLIKDCLKLREKHRLCDWAYLQMLDKVASAVYGGRGNGSTLLLAYLYQQSGYKMRLATDGKNLYMLFASKHTIYDKPSFSVNGFNYYGIDNLPDRLFICEAEFPEEKSLSLLINENQGLAVNTSASRNVKCKAYPVLNTSFTVNKNLIDFYSTYPSSMLYDNFMTRWSMYANTPMDAGIQAAVYPAWREILKNRSELEAVNMLLNFVQTGFEYEYDDVVWGGDRAFFAEESIYYLYCDCEDRAILFTRLVRDMLGLDCILVYYPGHLASAVCFSDSNAVKGDYIMLGNRKYVVCDPTYIGAFVGETMPSMDNSSAKVIKL